MASAAQRIAARELDPDALYTHGFPLERIDEAFEALERRPPGFMKAWLRMGE
jgi:threonine dehydrogenase-like Zn-dependent dehydrogenase